MADLTSPVSGPSAFGALTALALNCMFQPCGSVCGFPPRLRTYLRSSPFVCAADSVATIIRFGVYLLHGVSPTRAARAIFTLRFQNLDISELDGLQALEQQAWLRFFAFVIGLLLQTIKIFACGGIPWTQSVAAAYVASYLLLEILNILRSWSNDEDNAVITSQFTTLRNQKILKKIDLGLGICSFLAQSAFLAWALNSMLYPAWYVTTDGNTFHPGGLVILWGVILIPPFLVTVALAFLFEMCWHWPLESYFLRLFFALFYGVWAFFVCTLNWTPASFSTPAVVMEEILFIVVVVSILYLAAFSFSRFEFWRKQVLFLGHEDRRPAAWSFVLAVITIGVTMAWYMTRYDGAGTTKPDWTNWLG